jgi:hypothetical protein
MGTATMWTVDDGCGGKDVVARAVRAARVARVVRAWAARASRVARARSRAMNDHEEEIVPQINSTMNSTLNLRKKLQFLRRFKVRFV